MLIITPKAMKDIQNANEWYGEQSDGLNIIFLQHVDFYFKKIEKYPTIYMFVKEGIQRSLIIKFPYKIFFAVYKSDIIILRLRHNKQKPLKRFR